MKIEDSGVHETVNDILAIDSESLFKEPIGHDTPETDNMPLTDEQGKDCAQQLAEQIPDEETQEVSEVEKEEEVDELQTPECPDTISSANKSFEEEISATKRLRREKGQCPEELMDDLRPMWETGECTLCDPPVPLVTNVEKKRLRNFSRHFVDVHKRNTVKCLMCPRVFKTQDGCLHRHYKYEHYKGVFICSIGKCRNKSAMKRTFKFAQDYYQHGLQRHGADGEL